MALCRAIRECFVGVGRFFFGAQVTVFPAMSTTTPNSPPGSTNSGQEEHTPPAEDVEAGTAEGTLNEDSHREHPKQDRTERSRGGLLGFFFGRSYSQGPPVPLDLENMPLEKKREYYRCGDNYVTLDKIPTWEEESGCSDCSSFASKLSLWRGDITRLEIDAIVNAANSSLLGGGGVDGAIHRAAGRSLLEECRKLNGCDAGDAKLTGGHRLPAKYILHTVGPMDRSEHTLASCYTSCLKLVEEYELRSVAFCCVSTGVYGYPNEAAAHVALKTVREWLTSNFDKVDRIIFCVFLDIDYNIYKRLLRHYLTPTEEEEEGKSETEDPTAKNEIEDTDQETTEEGAEEVAKREENVPSNEGLPPLRRNVTEPAHSTALKPEVTQEKPEVVEQDERAEQEVGVASEPMDDSTGECNKNTDSLTQDTKRPKTTEED